MDALPSVVWQMAGYMLSLEESIEESHMTIWASAVTTAGLSRVGDG